MTTNRHPEYKLEDYTKDNSELAKEVEKEIKKQAITNYDKIRNMTVEEMAEFIVNRNDCEGCPCDVDDKDYCKGGSCNASVMAWLESESEE